MEQDQQQLMLKLSMFEQQIQQLQQQLEAVEKGIIELNSLSIGLDDLKGKTNKEILAPIGRGIFVKAKLSSEDLLVDIGEGNFVKKEIPDAKKLIGEQVQKLEDIKIELNNAMENLGQELNKTFMDAQAGHSCSCGEDCSGEECGDECECEKGKKK